MIFKDDKIYEILLFISHVILPTLSAACVAYGAVFDSQIFTLGGAVIAATDSVLGTFLLKCREFYHNQEGDNASV